MGAHEAFVPANAAEFTTRVVANQRLSRRYFLLRLERPRAFTEPTAGQFVHVAVPALDDRFFLRRPFSIHDCTRDTIDLVLVEVGPGSQALRRARAGDSIHFYGPLGNPYPVLANQRVLAIGGGVGLAPLYYYGFRSPGRIGDGYRLLYGARTREDLFLEHVALERKGVLLATDDGSYGFKGNVVQLAAAALKEEPADVLFSCGPTVMMRAAQELADRVGLPHFVSLENRMGCALGACRSCVVPTTLDGGSPYRTVCHDGPVFDAGVLQWEALPTP
jgi:dihydroorotate dehydrogenase electron transfer subunit